MTPQKFDRPNFCGEIDNNNINFVLVDFAVQKAT